MLGHETPKISEIDRRLKADNVKLKKRLHEPVMAERPEEAPPAETGCGEKSRDEAALLAPELRPQGYQMIIVGPHKIVGRRSGASAAAKPLLTRL